MRLKYKNLKKPASILVYSILVVVSYLLVDGIYKEYLQGKTAFYTEKKEIQIEDNPAVVIQFQMLYPSFCVKFGRDYTLNVLHWNEDQQEYLQDSSDVIQYNGQELENEFGLLSNISKGQCASQCKTKVE